MDEHEQFGAAMTKEEKKTVANGAQGLFDVKYGDKNRTKGKGNSFGRNDYEQRKK